MLIRYSDILVIQAPGRKRDNLQVFLESLLRVTHTIVADTPQSGLTRIQPGQRILIFVDQSAPTDEMGLFLETVRNIAPQAKVLLLQQHPQENHPYGNLSFDGVLFDGFLPHTLITLIDRLENESYSDIAPV